MRRNIAIGVGIVAVIIVLVAFFAFVLPPPVFSSEALLRRGSIQSDWSVKIDETHITGSAVWAKFAYYPDESIRLYHSAYWGAILFTEDGLSWVDDKDNLQEKALTLNNLTARWQSNGKTVPTSQQNGSSTFKFAFDNYYLKVVFTLPRADGSDYKYNSLDEAWESGELYFTITEW